MMKRILFPTLESKDFLGCKYPFTQNPYVADFIRNPTEMRLEWINGSQWWFVSLEDAERAEGPNVDYAHIDEARLVRHFDTAWLTVIRRLRKVWPLSCSNRASCMGNNNARQPRHTTFQCNRKP